MRLEEEPQRKMTSTIKRFLVLIKIVLSSNHKCNTQRWCMNGILVHRALLATYSKSLQCSAASLHRELRVEYVPDMMVKGVLKTKWKLGSFNEYIDAITDADFNCQQQLSWRSGDSPGLYAHRKLFTPWAAANQSLSHETYYYVVLLPLVLFNHMLSWS